MTAVSARSELTALSTPCLLLDLDRLTANSERMRARARSAGVRLRPHLKTLKSVDAARIAMDESRAITVSTLTEAAHFADHGFGDIVCAVCLPPDKLARALAIHSRIDGPGLAVLVDSVAVARTLVALVGGAPRALPVWIEIDCGEHRTGTDPQGAELLAIAHLLAACPDVELRGVLTHAGQSYGCDSIDAIRAVAEQERMAAVAAADRIRAAGIACPGVSVGSTPTAVHGTHWAGVTEMRPGVYMVGDLFQCHLQSLSPDDLALSVLATVISVRSDRIVIDAGGLALSKDRSMSGRPHDPGYGQLLDVQGNPLGLQVVGVHQEHGEVPLPPDAARPSVGERVRIWPNHACMTAAAYSGYHLLQAGRLVGHWPRINGWD